MSKRDIDHLIDEVGLPQAATQRKVVAILFTYRCTIRCRHCLFGCAGDRPDVAMNPRQCADGLALLHQTGRVVHIAGGEAMLYWDMLAASIRLAHGEGSAPHFIETNCSFAVDDAITRDRLEFLAAHSGRGIYASADIFHQEHVPPDRFLRVRRLTREIFGERNFYGPQADDAQIRELADIARDPESLREHVRRHSPNMVGAAHRQLSRYLDRFPPDSPELPRRGWQGRIERDNCLNEFRADTLWELHLDPYGNLQTNCGIILGKVEQISPADLLARGPEDANPFVRLLCERGPLGLAELARDRHGFTIPDQVTQTCQLCYLTRSFLRPFYPETFGPEEVYT